MHELITTVPFRCGWRVRCANDRALTPQPGRCGLIVIYGGGTLGGEQRADDGAPGAVRAAAERTSRAAAQEPDSGWASGSPWSVSLASSAGVTAVWSRRRHSDGGEAARSRRLPPPRRPPPRPRRPPRSPSPPPTAGTRRGASAAKKVSVPPRAPNYKAAYTAAINTNLGPIEIELA